MKYTIYIFLLFLILSCSLKPESMANDLMGKLEVLFDSNIQVLDLSTDKVEAIIEEKLGFQRIATFDPSPVDESKVLSILGSTKSPSRLVIYTQEKQFKTIRSYNFVGYPSFSPDGKSIAYLQGEYVIKKKNLIDDWFLNITDIKSSFNKKLSNISLYHFKPSWSPNGTQLAVTSKDLSIHLIDAKTGSSKKIIDYGVAPAFSKNGKFIAYLSKEIDSVTRVAIREYMNMSVEDYNNSSKGSAKKKELTEIEHSFLKYAIYTYNVETGENRKITHVLSIEAPVIWSPNDKYLLFNDERHLGHDIYFVKIKTGKIEKVTEHRGQIMAWKK